MLRKGHILVILFVAVSVTTASTVYAEQFFVKTDKSFYEPGNIIVISGFINNLNENYDQPVLIRIVDPENNIVSIQQVDTNSNGTFESMIEILGTFKEAGQYTVYASYGASKGETTFEFAGGEGYTPPPKPGTETNVFEVDVGDYGTFDIEYSVQGISILDIFADPDEIQVTLQVKVNKIPNLLTITFDRDSFDATFEGNDDAFFVITDGDFIDIEETETTSESRSITFELRPGTEEVSIFGTKLLQGSGGTLPEPEVIEEPEVTEPKPESVPKVPEWVRNIFIWYAEEKISEDDLLGAIQFLIDQGILKP